MVNKKLTSFQSATLTKKQLVNNNSNMVKRLNTCGAFLFRLRWDETLFQSKGNAQPVTVISVAENRNLGDITYNIGLYLDEGDILYVVSKSKELIPGYVHTSSSHYVKYTVEKSGICREPGIDSEKDLMKLVNLSNNVLTSTVNAEIIFNLLGKNNLATLPNKRSIMSVMFRNDVDRKVRSDQLWYKLSEYGSGRICTLNDYKQDADGCYTLDPEEVYVKCGNDRKGLIIYSGNGGKLSSIKDQLLKTWSIDSDASAYFSEADTVGEMFDVIPKILF